MFSNYQITVQIAKLITKLPNSKNTSLFLLYPILLEPIFVA
jgi:hypothetical protein